MDTYVVTASSLNLRSTPKMADNITGSLKRGTIVELLGKSDDGHWLNVRKGAAKTGWGFAKYLATEGEEVLPVVEHEEFPWMSIAVSEVGTKEVPGDGSNPRVVEYLKSTDLDSVSASKDSTYWCSGFVNWCVEKAGYAGSNSAWARSWLSWGKAIARPRRGCIAVFKRGSGGHVAFYVGGDGDKYRVLGGNQKDSVCIDGYAKSRLLGFRVPA
ncbi:MAG: SH3 domain-containing C40 family peptidase [Deltaproteobacteria bacterium]